jgi:hypothetical protein
VKNLSYLCGLKQKKMKTTIATLLTLFTIFVMAITLIQNITLKQNCTGYLKRAADSNSVETAKSQLQMALRYMEDNNLTTGYTSVLWRTPDEDIAFWYNNIKDSELELSNVDSTTSSLEKSNMLLKLRETLLDGGEKGEVLTVPNGLSRYPNNLLWGVLRLLASVTLIGLIIWGSVEFN